MDEKCMSWGPKDVDSVHSENAVRWASGQRQQISYNDFHTLTAADTNVISFHALSTCRSQFRSSSGCTGIAT